MATVSEHGHDCDRDGRESDRGHSCGRGHEPLRQRSVKGDGESGMRQWPGTALQGGQEGISFQ